MLQGRNQDLGREIHRSAGLFSLCPQNLLTVIFCELYLDDDVQWKTAVSAIFVTKTVLLWRAPWVFFLLRRYTIALLAYLHGVNCPNSMNPLKSLLQQGQCSMVLSATAFHCAFLPRDAASAVYDIALCLCVSVSVTSRSFTKTAKGRNTQTAPYVAQGL